MIRYIQKTPDNYFIHSMHFGERATYMQRGEPTNATDSQLNGYEKIIIELCDKILESQTTTLTCDLKDGEFTNGRRE